MKLNFSVNNEDRVAKSITERLELILRDFEYFSKNGIKSESSGQALGLALGYSESLMIMGAITSAQRDCFVKILDETVQYNYNEDITIAIKNVTEEEDEYEQEC